MQIKEINKQIRKTFKKDKDAPKLSCLESKVGTDGKTYLLIDCEEFELVFEAEHFFAKLRVFPVKYDLRAHLKNLSAWMPVSFDEIGILCMDAGPIVLDDKEDGDPELGDPQLGDPELGGAELGEESTEN